MKLPTLDMTYYVLRARPSCEHLAQEELRKGGYFGYVPTYLKLRRVGPHRDRSLVPTPLYRGYLFLMAERGSTVAWGEFHDEWRYPHVGRPLCDLNGPARIDPATVVSIHVEEVERVYDDKVPEARNRRRNRIRDLKELFAAMEAAEREKIAA
jgi:hypothetical protein